MKKTILFGIAIVTAFVVGVLSANPEVGAVSGWKAAVADIESILFNITGVPCTGGQVVSGYAVDGTPICVSQIEIMRIDGGRLSTIADTSEVYFLDGEETSKGDDASDFEFASKMVGIDGTIREVQYKIGKSSDAVSVTAKLYKNNVEIGSCTFSTSTSSHTSCTMTLNEPVVKGDLLAMSDRSSQRIDVEGKSAFVVITRS